MDLAKKGLDAYAEHQHQCRINRRCTQQWFLTFPLFLADNSVNKTGGHEYNSPDNSGGGGYGRPESECDRRFAWLASLI